MQPPAGVSATSALVRDLNELGFRVGVRAVRYWTSLGLVPAPIRHHLGRGRGTTSTYESGALEQFAAVASVMRRGRPWQIAVVALVGRGHLPTSEASLRAAFEWFFCEGTSEGESVFDRAEQLTSETRSSKATSIRQLVRAMDTNFQRAKIKDPLTGQVVPPREGVDSVLTSMALLVLGRESLDEEAGLRVAAALGLLLELPCTIHEAAGELVADIANDVLRLSTLRDTARTIEPARLRSAVLNVRETLNSAVQSPYFRFRTLPTSFWDVACAVLGLVIVGADSREGSDPLVGRHRSTLEAIANSFDSGPSCSLPRPKEPLFAGKSNRLGRPNFSRQCEAVPANNSANRL